MDPSGATTDVYRTLGANSRDTIHVNEVAGFESNDVSAEVVCTNGLGIAVERAMYWNAGGVTWAAGHCTIGTPVTSSSWYLAEGNVGEDFSEYILLANPGITGTNVHITYLLENGTIQDHDEYVGPSSRFTIHVNDELTTP